MTAAQREWALERMRRLDFARWDRYTDTNGWILAYGWLPRLGDAHTDFVALVSWTTEDGEPVGFAFTSSARWSREIMKRMEGTSEGHVDCERIEHGFPELDTAIRLPDPPPPPEPKRPAIPERRDP